MPASLVRIYDIAFYMAVAAQLTWLFEHGNIDYPLWLSLPICLWLVSYWALRGVYAIQRRCSRPGDAA